MSKNHWAYRAGDWSLASLLFLVWAWHAVRMIFAKLEWYDWVAYALPGANLVEHGRLCTPQLGSQFQFDRTWLFNAPLMGAGSAVFYQAFGTGRISFLIGMSMFALLNLAVFTWIIRHGFKLESVALSMFCAFAFVEQRNYVSFCTNQRYDILAYSILMVAFMPMKAALPSVRWLCAGVLPLLHPALIPASVVWLAACGVSGWKESERNWRRIVGPVLFALAWLAAACWYGRIDGLQSQFLPHLRFHSESIAEGGNTWRMLHVAAAFPYWVPARVETLLIAGTALGILITAIVKRGRTVQVGVLVPAGLIVGIVLLDATRGLSYWAFYVLGLAPCLLFAFRESRIGRRVALVVVIMLASANSSVSLWLDRTQQASFVGALDSLAFLVENTSRGENLVLGPPFVLAAADRFLPDGRRVSRVVPQPFYLKDFDRDRFRAGVAAQRLTYIGEPRFFHEVTIGGGVGKASAPLFDDAEIEQANFYGVPVIIARPKRQNE